MLNLLSFIFIIYGKKSLMFKDVQTKPLENELSELIRLNDIVINDFSPNKLPA